MGQAEEEEGGRVESYEKALDKIQEEHETWTLTPCMIADVARSVPGVRLVCKCGIVAAFITSTVDEDFIYDRWGDHVQLLIDEVEGEFRLKPIPDVDDDYDDEDEVDDIIFIDLDDEELETEI